MFLVNGFLCGSWAPQIPLLLPRLAITESTVGLLILLLGLGSIATMLTTGRLINHFGSKKICLAFASLSCLAFALLILAPTVPLVVPAIILMGAAIGSMDVAMNANAVEIEKQLRRAVMSSSHGFWSLGGFLGSAAGAFLIPRLSPAHHALIASAAALATVLAAAPFLVTEPHHQNPATPKPKYTRPKGFLIYLLGIMALFCMMPEGAVLDWSALYLNKQLHAPLSTAGLGFAFFSAAMAAMRFLGDRLRNRLGAVNTLRISCLTAAAGMLAAALAPHPALAIAAFTLAGLGIANTVPIAFSAAGNQPNLSPGAGISTVTLIGYSGILIAPSSIGFAAEHIGFRLTYITLALLLLTVATLAPHARAANHQPPPTPEDQTPQL
jgi:MFS family permease